MMGSSELDVGSNDELFWFWIKRNKPRALFYCRHDQFGSSNARQMIPVDPGWLAERVAPDGSRERISVLRANRVMRGVRLPAGEHRLVFRYRPRWLPWAVGIRAASWLAQAGAALARRRRAA